MFDAHSHWQDERLDAVREVVAGQMPSLGVQGVVVDGSSAEDWEAVVRLARRHGWVLPSFGVHPWYVKEQPPDWQERLVTLLDAFPHAGVGEIGLDRWIENADVELQQRFFSTQLKIAAGRNRPVSIHCLRAFGLLEEALRGPVCRPRGFLLHSYGGPAEMVPAFVKLGGFFSISPYFFHERKARQLETFRRVVPLERLLIETDAPDMWPPDALNPHPLADASGRPLNDPRNLVWMYDQVARLRGMPPLELRETVNANFRRWWFDERNG